MQNFIQEGRTMTYTNGDLATIESGGVVPVGNLLGIANGQIVANATGVLLMEGVFELPKAPGVVIAQGDLVGWDISKAAFMPRSAAESVNGTGNLTGAGVAWEAASFDQTVLRVKINTGMRGLS